VPEDESSHDPQSTPLTSAYLVLAHGKRMGFSFGLRHGQLIVSPASRLSEDDKEVLRHFKKDIVLCLLTESVFRNEPARKAGHDDETS
jgi:galactose-1-phosphate uridylyltransferase